MTQKKTPCRPSLNDMENLVGTWNPERQIAASRRPAVFSWTQRNRREGASSEYNLSWLPRYTTTTLANSLHAECSTLRFLMGGIVGHQRLGIYPRHFHGQNPACALHTFPSTKRKNDFLIGSALGRLSKAVKSRRDDPWAARDAHLGCQVWAALPLYHHPNPQFPQLALRYRRRRFDHQVLRRRGFGEGDYFS